ncbi:MAG: HD domain-containing protein [Lachnospiraceae bacterium]|nr:HD domain-containing protein [Lachnospiraceae bacterium]
MKLCKTSDLKGGEILARPIMTSEFKVLLSDGVVIRPEYIPQIIKLGILEVYVKEEHIDAQTASLLKSDVENIFHDKVKTIMEKHTYHNNKELSELSKTADNIIASVLEEEEVVDRIFDIKERSSDVYEHSVSICSFATLLALKLKLSKESVHDIAVGCLLHDLGLRYLEIPFTNKDSEDFSDTESVEYHKHPVYGYTTLQNEKWISDLSKKIILCHHENIAGMGYPLRRKNLPYEVKLVSVCDTFDEMICGIGHKRQKVYKAVEYLKTFRGMLFDAEIVDTFLEFTAVYPAGSNVLLSDGAEGTVIRQNKEFPDRPVIKIIKPGSDPGCNKGASVDLTKINHIFVEKVLE